MIARFFRGTFNKFIFKARYALVVVLIILGITAGVGAWYIGPPIKQQEYIPSNDPLIMLKTEVQDHFASHASFDEAIVVKLNWGIKDLDRSDVGLWDSIDVGRLVWDEEFTVSPRRN